MTSLPTPPASGEKNDILELLSESTPEHVDCVVCPAMYPSHNNCCPQCGSQNTNPHVGSDLHHLLFN